MEGPRPPFFSRLWGAIWGKWPVWMRHCFYWAFALIAIGLTLLPYLSAKQAQSHGVVSFFWLVLVLIIIVSAIVGLVFTLRGWESAGAARTTSRSLVLFAVLLGLATALLSYARRWGCPSRPAAR